MNPKCHEFFGCKNLDCAMFVKREKRNCWDVEIASTPFVKFGAGILAKETKISFCKNCLYYLHIDNSKERSSLSIIVKNDNG